MRQSDGGPQIRWITFACLFYSLCLAGCRTSSESENTDIVFPTPEMVLEAQKRGTAIRQMVLAAEQVELISIDPLEGKGLPDRLPAIGEISGFKIIGQSLCQSRNDINILADALDKGISKGTLSAGCFLPRHALMLESAGQSVPILICFHCANFRTGAHMSYFPISAEIESTFDAIFAAYGLPKAHFPTQEELAEMEQNARRLEAESEQGH